jgi:hypothetical protein
MITYKLRKTQKCEIILKDSKYQKKKAIAIGKTSSKVHMIYCCKLLVQIFISLLQKPIF